MRRRDEVEKIVELLKELWDDLATEAAVSTFSAFCKDEQLTSIREKLENDIRLRNMVKAHFNETNNAPSKQMTVAESEKQ